MEPKLRQTLDADLYEEHKGESSFETDQNRYAMKCGICFTDCFVDNVTYENVCRAIEEGTDNPFVCDECRISDEEQAGASA